MRRALRRLCFYLQGGKKGSALNIAHSLFAFVFTSGQSLFVVFVYVYIDVCIQTVQYTHRSAAETYFGECFMLKKDVYGKRNAPFVFFDDALQHFNLRSSNSAKNFSNTSWIFQLLSKPVGEG